MAEVVDASEASLGGPGGAGKMDVHKQGQVVGTMVFDLMRFPGSCTMWQLDDGGVQPPWSAVLVGQGKLRCAPNTVFYYRFFCLPVSCDFAKNVDILGYLDVNQSKTL